MASYVWDLYFLDGEVTLYTTGVAILNIVAPHILPKPSAKTARASARRYQLLGAEPEEEEDEESAIHRVFDRTR